MRRSLEISSTVLVCLLLMACPGEKPPASPVNPPPAAEVSSPAASAGGATLEDQIKSGRPSLLAGVTDKGAKKGIMKEVSKQLGEQCDYCHDVADFDAATVNKTLGNYMFTHFSHELAPKTGGVLGCGDCHQGKAKFLGDRSNKERISAFMKAEYVAKLQLQGGGAVTCETCHTKGAGKPFLPR